MTNPIVEIEDLHIDFPISGGGAVPAVDGISLTVNAGETFGIIGESGSGKTTLGRALVCLERPSEGRISHAGVDPWSLAPRELRRHRRNYQIIFQDSNAALNPRRTILQSVMEPLEVSDVPKADRRSVALGLLGRVGLDDVMAERYPHELSGGQKQRANIARALTANPDLIVCDESVAALDVSIQAEILNLLARLQRENGLTYVFITHSLSVIGHISDRIAVMYLGRWMELGPADDILDRPLHPYTQALLSAEPMPRPPGEESRSRITLAGETPGPGAFPSGCRFRNRCAHASELCATSEPEWREHRPGQWAACHFAGAIPWSGDHEDARSVDVRA